MERTTPLVPRPDVFVEDHVRPLTPSKGNARPSPPSNCLGLPPHPQTKDPYSKTLLRVMRSWPCGVQDFAESDPPRAYRASTGNAGVSARERRVAAYRPRPGRGLGGGVTRRRTVGVWNLGDFAERDPVSPRYILVASGLAAGLVFVRRAVDSETVCWRLLVLGGREENGERGPRALGRGSWTVFLIAMPNEL